MSTSTQRELFPVTAERQFVDVVFDFPVDHAYTYGVPDELSGNIAVGKRVLAPFGKGGRSIIGYCVRVTDTAPDRTVKPIRRVLDDEIFLSDELLRLTRWVADYYLCGWGQVLNAVVPTGAKTQAGLRTLTLVEAIPEADLPASSPPLTPKQETALDRLRRSRAPVELHRLSQQARCGIGPIENLIRKGYARRLVAHREKSFDLGSAGAQEPITLNADQRRAWSNLEPAVINGGFHVFLLHGVTGSGKTEIYLRAIDEVIKQGKQAIVLVPEISLTPQTIDRFRGRCQDQIAVLHSHLSHADRGTQWRRTARGEAAVIVGARSAVFAPTSRLGLIVVDEEHEGSFKQDMTPRYHAHDVGVMRARLENIPIILGSATPSLESWHNAERGQYTLLSLPKRVLDRALPPVGLIDLRHDTSGRSRFHAISPQLERSMRDALRDGGQVILLLNRRGFSTRVQCPTCGHVATCRHCDLALTYHRARDVMLCHYCGYTEPPPETCVKCGHRAIRFQGLGTEKLQAELESKFSGRTIRRMDSDSMRQRGSHERVLSAFRQGLIHILLGTQMIAKGLDFPNVTLVGVVNADVGLHIPDFRSAERTFQLLSQVAGRAGRGALGGKVTCSDIQSGASQHRTRGSA